MKIAFLSTMYPYRGGIAQFNALLFREFEKKHTVSGYTFKRQYPDFLFPGQTQYVTENDNADKIPVRRMLDTINPFTYMKTARAIRNEAPDIFITKYWMTFFAPSLGYVAGHLGKKTRRISILDNVIPHEKRFFDASFNRYFLKRNDGFIVMSDKVLADLLSIVPDAKYLRVNHPVYNHFGEKLEQSTAKEKLGLEPGKKTLLFFGIIRDYKGLDLLIEALSLLDDSFELIIAGEVYGSFENYQKQINQFGLGNKIHLFKQYIDDDHVTTFFSASDVCILPYKSATQSGITSIANHFDLPIIATDVGGLKETIEHGKTGLIVDKAEPALIAEAIRNYFDNDLKASFAENIRQEKKENSWENFARKVLEFAAEIKRD